MTAETYVGTELELFQHATRWKGYFTDQIRPFLGKRVLEVGAGLGGTTTILCDAQAERWVCLEPDDALATQMREKIRSGELPRCCEAITGTLEDVGAEEFDAILYVDVLEHIEDDAAELERAATKLAPGGHLLVLSPAYQWLFSPFDAAIGHYRRYSRSTLLAAAPDHLELARVRYLDSVGVMASGANRFLMKQGMPTANQLQFWDRVLVPASRWVDPLLLYAIGKSIVGVWRRPRVASS